jgi:hypothetical protein
LGNFILADGGSSITATGNALSAASIEQILARCVASGVTTDTILLDGGTNANLASLSAQGQADYATLFAAGNNTSINLP